MSGDVIGREPELAILHRFLDSIPTGPSALLLSGDPGIGKTTVLEARAGGSPRARLPDALVQPRRGRDASLVHRPRRPRRARPGREPADDPEPQRAALEVALLRSPRTGGRTDQRAVSLAVLGCIRAVASTARRRGHRRRAVDGSAVCSRFAVRRPASDCVRLARAKASTKYFPWRRADSNRRPPACKARLGRVSDQPLCHLRRSWA